MRKKIIYGLILIAAIGMIFAFAGNGGGELEVAAYKASRIQLSKTIDLTGTVEALDYEEITMAPGIKVLKVYVKENQLVVKGQILAELDPGDTAYKLEKLEINGKQLKQELAELQKPSRVSDLMSVKNKVAKAESTYNSIERQLKEKEELVMKAESLYLSGAVAESEYKAQVSSRDNLADQLAQAEIELNNTENELSDYGRNNSLEIQAKNRQIAANEADIKSLEKQLSDTVIRSSSHGTLVEFPLKEGRSVLQGDVIRIYDMSQLIFKGMLTQEDAVQVKQGQSAAVMLEGLDKEYTAEVYGIKRYAKPDQDSASLTPKIEVQLRLLDGDEALAVGFEADAVITVEEASGVLSIPRESVRKGADGQNTVFLVKEGVVKSAGITPGIYDDFMIEIKAGAAEGDLVVVNPPETLKDGDHVSIYLK